MIEVHEAPFGEFYDEFKGAPPPPGSHCFRLHSSGCGYCEFKFSWHWYEGPTPCEACEDCGGVIQ